jgi:ADP-ribosylglycohydrolase
MNKLYGAILGDLAGQPYEFDKSYKKPFNIHNPDSHITDDTILTLAGALSIMLKTPIEDNYRRVSKKYPDCGFGKGYIEWLRTRKGTLGDSYGNGCLMRMSPFMYSQEPLKLTMQSVLTSHGHEESVQSVMKLYNLYKGIYPEKVTKPSRFHLFSARAIHSIDFCESVFMFTKSTHHAIEVAVVMGGDTDTHASIVGELSNFTYNDISEEDVQYVESKLDTYLLGILQAFNKLKY